MNESIYSISEVVVKSNDEKVTVVNAGEDDNSFYSSLYQKQSKENDRVMTASSTFSSFSIVDSKQQPECVLDVSHSSHGDDISLNSFSSFSSSAPVSTFFERENHVSEKGSFFFCYLWLFSILTYIYILATSKDFRIRFQI
jgi:hypothetical protein